MHRSQGSNTNWPLLALPGSSGHQLFSALLLSGHALPQPLASNSQPGNGIFGSSVSCQSQFRAATACFWSQRPAGPELHTITTLHVGSISVPLRGLFTF